MSSTTDIRTKAREIIAAFVREGSNAACGTNAHQNGWRDAAMTSTVEQVLLDAPPVRAADSGVACYRNVSRNTNPPKELRRQLLNLARFAQKHQATA